MNQAFIGWIISHMEYVFNVSPAFRKDFLGGLEECPPLAVERFINKMSSKWWEDFIHEGGVAAGSKPEVDVSELIQAFKDHFLALTTE